MTMKRYRVGISYRQRAEMMVFAKDEKMAKEKACRVIEMIVGTHEMKVDNLSES